MKTAWVVLVLGMLAGCGGGGGDSGGGGGGGGTPPPPAPPPAGIGSAGGTVTGPSNAQVVIPAGALSTNTQIAVEQSSAGAPALPGGVTTYGQMFAFTPHGTTFASAVTVTVPFDPTLVPAGTTPALYKTNSARDGWEQVPGATVSGSTMSAQITSFSNLVVGSAEFTVKTWTLQAYDYALHMNPYGPSEIYEHGTQFGGTLDKLELVGDQLPFPPPGQPDPRARVAVFSNRTGDTFWTFAEAPRPSATQYYNTSNADLAQRYTFQKTEEGAKLKFVVSAASVEALDDGSRKLNQQMCPWVDANATQDELEAECGEFLEEAIDSFSLKARKLGDARNFLSIGGDLQVHGHRGAWIYGATYRADEELRLWDISNYTVDLHKSSDPGLGHTTLTLNGPITIEVPLDKVPLQGKFNVSIDMGGFASNLLQGETEVNASLKDPLQANGLTMEFSGMVQLPFVDEVPADPVADPCPTAPVPEAGTIQFSAANYRAPERPRGADVIVTRTGGSTGPVIVQFETSDGTALAGDDYQTLKTLVYFGDGQDGERVVQVPLVLDDTAEPDKSLNVTLTSFSGCAALGSQTTATVTILDDDRPIASPTTFTVSGTISGLQGTGLALEDVFSGPVVSSSATAFTLATALQDGSPYDVRVTTQPSNPAQNCTVTDGSGVVQGANVTNIVVTCAGLAPSGSLDDGFGNHGKAVSPVYYAPNLYENRIGMALQPDGKILMVGGLKLLRFNTDGTPDTQFGTNGVVDVVLGNATDDQAMDVVVQSTGKIVVAGTTSTFVVGSDDFALVRYNSDGSLDTTFGNAGHVRTDFFGSADDVWRLKLLAGDVLLAVGTVTKPVKVGASTTTVGLFGLARYTADGALDTSFSGDGLYADAPGGPIASGRSVMVQDDGKFVIAGSTRVNGGSSPHAGVIRLIGDDVTNQAGTPDNTFGPQTNGALQLSLADSDEIVDSVELGDHTILGLVDTSQLGSTGFGLVHVPPTGVPIPPFVQPLITFTSDNDRPRGMLRTAGVEQKIVVVGQAGNHGANADMAIARFDADGSALDPSFGNGGKLTLDFFGAQDSAEAVLQQSDGKLIVGGYAHTSTGNVFALVRLAK